MTSGVHAEERDGRMSFRVPVRGRVVVRNESYEDAEEHTYVVELAGVEPDSCTCDDYQYRRRHAPDGCKHMEAVARRPAVVAAACGAYGTPEELRDQDDDADLALATDGGPDVQDVTQARAEIAVDRITAEGGRRYRGGRR